jgi:hypothetical protein
LCAKPGGYDPDIQGSLRRLLPAVALLAALAVPAASVGQPLVSSAGGVGKALGSSAAGMGKALGSSAAGMGKTLASSTAGVDQTCELTATRFDPDTVNVLYPDSSAQYWSATFTAVPGTRIRIDGIFPYARYTSWNLYDPLLRPFAKASDYQLQPDAGSANPFVPGAARNTPESKRQYTLFITFSPGDHPGPNTIYVDPSQHPTGVLTLRVYEPDRGRDATGGVGLPQITWEPTSALGAPATGSPCQNVEKPTSSELTGAYASQDGPSLGAPYPGQDPPDWHKFVNICQSGSDLLFDNPLGDQVPQTG